MQSHSNTGKQSEQTGNYKSAGNKRCSCPVQGTCSQASLKHQLIGAVGRERKNGSADNSACQGKWVRERRQT
ncbi:hypothetical protein AA103581_2111 [Gluconobacter wancherniae NBRC 103581]|nr:hypothetical protein AA103581_2111 [Gluconobacter wancherniae NBRC 103581]